MIYYCENCGFLFCRTGEIKTCPFCEVNRIRFANTEEASRLLATLAEEGSYDQTTVV